MNASKITSRPGPKITSRPAPKITPNTDYAEDGYPVTRFERYPAPAPSSLVDAFHDADSNVKILPNGNIAIGDV